MNSSDTLTLEEKFISPVDREIMESIIRAMCQRYGIKEADLTSTPVTSEQTNVRRVCFYMIVTNTSLRHKVIANRFNASRSAVSMAAPIIDLHKNLYRPTKDLINTVARIANSFEKKQQWHIQLIS